MSETVSPKEAPLKRVLRDHSVCSGSSVVFPFVAGPSPELARAQRFPPWMVISLGFMIGATLLATSNCGTSHAILNFTAPQTAVGGFPFTVTVSVTINGHPDTEINSRIHFTSSDAAATLPGDYYFTSADAGAHTWPRGFILRTPGNQSISGKIIDATGINGSISISVSP